MYDRVRARARARRKDFAVQHEIARQYLLGATAHDATYDVCAYYSRQCVS